MHTPPRPPLPPSSSSTTCISPNLPFTQYLQSVAASELVNPAAHALHSLFAGVAPYHPEGHCSKSIHAPPSLQFNMYEPFGTLTEVVPPRTI